MEKIVETTRSIVSLSNDAELNDGEESKVKGYSVKSRSGETLWRRELEEALLGAPTCFGQSGQSAAMSVAGHSAEAGFLRIIV